MVCCRVGASEPEIRGVCMDKLKLNDETGDGALNINIENMNYHTAN